MTTTSTTAPDRALLFDIANREITALLREIALRIAAGDTAPFLAPDLRPICAAVPSLPDDIQRRFATLLMWSMHVQHVTTCAEAGRRKRIDQHLQTFYSDDKPF